MILAIIVAINLILGGFFFLLIGVDNGDISPTLRTLELRIYID